MGGDCSMRDIHNSDVLTFLEDNKNNANIKKALVELDKSVATTKTYHVAGKDITPPTYDSYFEYLEENIGDDAMFTLSELKQVKRGDIQLKCTNKTNIQLIPMIKLVTIKYIGMKKDKQGEITTTQKQWNSFVRKNGKDAVYNVYKIIKKFSMPTEDYIEQQKHKQAEASA